MRPSWPPSPRVRRSWWSTTSSRAGTPTPRSTGHRLPVDLAFADVRPEDYQALVIPGGRAPEYIRTDPDVARIVHHFFERGLPVGTICHGPQVPAALGLLRGRTTAAFPPLRADMEMAGATFVDAPDVVDGAMVSCRGWPDLPEWSRAFMRVLEGANVSL
ncbi:DJ-1/PfpI family protein [Nonomuraea sp. KM88]|uniref:DJ-1/PfpI family protein n=1 Tax=Nonomuraea sp. KM88 TaxID=3457427 RepID=UPI003FCC4002